MSSFDNIKGDQQLGVNGVGRESVDIVTAKVELYSGGAPTLKL